MINTTDFIKFEQNFYSKFKKELSLADNALRSDLAKICFCLQNESFILNELAKLEGKLNNYLIEKQIDKEDFLFKDDTKNQKILSTSLNSWGSTFFKKVEKTNDFITREFFLEKLADLTMFKDIGAESSHGEWSHFIQWYLIANSSEVESSLSLPLNDVYKKIGNPKFNWLDNDWETLWSITFDNEVFDFTISDLNNKSRQDLDDEVPFNFSSPEYVNFYLCKSFETFPILSKCIYDRYLKRTEKEEEKRLIEALYN